MKSERERYKTLVRKADEIQKDYFEKHTNIRRNWEFPEGFPSLEVIEAYKKPEVNESTEKFYHDKTSMAKKKQPEDEEVKDVDPDFDELRSYISKNLNWSQQDFHQYIIQVERKRVERNAERKKKNPTIDQYFQKELPMQGLKSQRMIRAVREIKGQKK